MTVAVFSSYVAGLALVPTTALARVDLPVAQGSVCDGERTKRGQHAWSKYIAWHGKCVEAPKLLFTFSDAVTLACLLPCITCTWLCVCCDRMRTLQDYKDDHRTTGCAAFSSCLPVLGAGPQPAYMLMPGPCSLTLTIIQSAALTLGAGGDHQVMVALPLEFNNITLAHSQRLLVALQVFRAITQYDAMQKGQGSWLAHRACITQCHHFVSHVCVCSTVNVQPI